LRIFYAFLILPIFNLSHHQYQPECEQFSNPSIAVPVVNSAITCSKMDSELLALGKDGSKVQPVYTPANAGLGAGAKVGKS